ncbi:peptidoglycan DD-metalloendopeptidase family protein [Alteromonas ponticola]|uniref:Peptidoglycan DD-metalloendopeptidase family protein n=2 Tax=Alteromonas aquimaris TaxID=2998417 RepID=A0ABT3P2Y9_9ALTE|nr:peptidoglycan DD-metalloendopeptidase family protein [Alteromonas aquimaris]MCW8106905.1 peptidoglycan DD-metalloendopeptidase family protein [Alteromonas aquimaris]
MLWLYSAMMLALPALAQDSQQDKLAELQAQLKERQQRLAANQASAEELQKALQRSEEEIGRTARQLQTTKNNLAENQKEQADLQQQQQELTQAIIQQQDALASQLKSAFMSGNYDYAKLFFYQEEASKFERILTYYQYINNARQQEISKFRNNVESLKTVNLQLEQKGKELAKLLSQQESQQAQLLARQSDRKQTLAKLNNSIASDEAQVAALQASEKALLQTIEEANRRAAAQQQVELKGLGTLKGKLIQPAAGTVRRLFGQRRQGQVRWKGIVIEGSEGSSVKSVSQGRVLYADWLRGFGLVTIIDHGDGYMSVYGHNQALLKQAGDDVRQGDTIALLGQSGGQSYPNLYFEIRHKGKALNPTSWLDL